MYVCTGGGASWLYDAIKAASLWVKAVIYVSCTPESSGSGQHQRWIASSYSSATRATGPVPLPPCLPASLPACLPPPSLSPSSCISSACCAPVKYAAAEGNVSHLCPCRDKFMAQAGIYSPSQLMMGPRSHSHGGRGGSSITPQRPRCCQGAGPEQQLHM